MSAPLKAGAAQVEISPQDSQFLFGYPHVERYSEGVHDPLWSSALYLDNGNVKTMFIANDIIYVSKGSVNAVRGRVAEQTGIPADHIMITATHTHSGPKTIGFVSTSADEIEPPADPKYVQFMEDRIVDAAVQAFNNAQPAELGLEVADGTGVGTNRRDPNGPADPEVPVLLVRNAETQKNIAVMVVYSMHPTVLHEDTKLVTGDFPGMTRIYLQDNVVGKDCPVVYHMGPSGNQSPRHVTTANTFEEADRLGQMLGKAIEKVIGSITFASDVDLKVALTSTDLPRRTFPSVEEAKAKLDKAVAKLEHLRTSGAPREETRTAECDWFGAEETYTLSKLYASGELEKAYQSCLPADLQMIQVGPWKFVGWPGEIFVEYGLKLKEQVDNAFVISTANGELQGYIVTPEADEEGGYEASNAMFSPESGEIFIQKSCQMIS